MADPLQIEACVPKKNFYNTRRFQLAVVVAIILLCAIFSILAWLSGGRIKSVAARIDGLVYTVAPQFNSKILNIEVAPGAQVNSGQVLAKLEFEPLPAPAAAADNINGQNEAPGADSEQMTARFRKVVDTERSITEKVTAARNRENTLREHWQATVTAHVRAQLAMRSGASYNNEAARQAELAARTAMEKAKDDFEKASKSRAAIERELGRMRQDIQATKKLMSSKPEKTANLLPEATKGQLLSPVNGRIVRINGKTGQNLVKGQPLFLIRPLGNGGASDAFWAMAWFPATSRIKAGQKAELKFANMHGKNFSGMVEKVDEPAPLPVDIAQLLPGFDDITKDDLFVAVRVNFTNGPSVIELGDTGECEIQTRYFFGMNPF